ncbi:hypothetical protein O0L34_g13684 [Tuta absoluta]|nr:hypothetical protein O0L34_g13684 [Tuta absoluta]
MCWADKCCFFIKLDPGCVIIGFISLILSTVMIATSAVYFSMDLEEHSISTHNPILTKVLTFVLTPHQKTVVLCSVLAMGVMLLFASVMLMVGICKKKSGFVLFYFGFGIFFAIFSMLGAILLMLQTHWGASITIFITCGIYIHFLVVIHTLYEHMQKEIYGDDSHGILIEEDSISIASQVTGLD